MSIGAEALVRSAEHEARPLKDQLEAERRVEQGDPVALTYGIERRRGALVVVVYGLGISKEFITHEPLNDKEDVLAFVEELFAYQQIGEAARDHLVEMAEEFTA